MSSKKAMKLAQKQAYAKHRSNITNSRFGSKKINFTSKVNKKKQINDLKKYINEWSGDNNLVLVTHYVIIQEVLNITSSSGELIIADKNFNILARQNF